MARSSKLALAMIAAVVLALVICAAPADARRAKVPCLPCRDCMRPPASCLPRKLPCVPES